MISRKQRCHGGFSVLIDISTSCMMPLTQEKRLESNITNNNDHNYLHKKFKKMASTVPLCPGQYSDGDAKTIEADTSQISGSAIISNGSIAAAHPEIEKIKESQVEHPYINKEGKNVQTNYKTESTRISNINIINEVPGKTSYTDEFLNKTENLENDVIKESQSGAPGGRYVCPYCKLSCAKPSVLQKHIRAHTNERPYPCVPCGFAFKTKSNLYKHRRSRTHALRLQGTDISAALNEEELSGGSESDCSQPPILTSDTGTEASVAQCDLRVSEISSPELSNDRFTPPSSIMVSLNEAKSKSIYKPKFRAALYQDSEKDKVKKAMSHNADFLTEHISKIISDNEAIVDVIESPLQKKYSKIKQIAESKQFLIESPEIKVDSIPLNLTKVNTEHDNSFRKRSHSESFSQLEQQKHPLNPEGSIIKDLLLKTKANGLISVTELVDGPLYICPVCQISFRSADNLEVHQLYYCKANTVNNSVVVSNQKDVKLNRSETLYVRSNSFNVQLPVTTQNSFTRTNVLNKSPPIKCKPNNIVIVKPETNDIIAPLPSPGPLLGNTRLVDSKTVENSRKSENSKVKPISPKKRVDNRPDTYSPRREENNSPRSLDMYTQSKIRCIDPGSSSLRSVEDICQQMRNNSTSLQMFGGEVKIVDHSGSTTTLRIEPSKNQLSPILIHQNLSPSKLVNDVEASSVVVRSGLHSGGTIVHNPPTPKDVVGTPQPHTPRLIVSTVSSSHNSSMPIIHDVTHFQFPPLSAITAFNPLTLPPLSPSLSPNGASTILHGGKLIPHVPGIPGPNTSNIFLTSPANSKNNESHKKICERYSGTIQNNLLTVNIGKAVATTKHESYGGKGANIKCTEIEHNKNHEKSDTKKYYTTVPIIKVKNVDDSSKPALNHAKQQAIRHEGILKRNAEGFPKVPIMKDNINHQSNKIKLNDHIAYNSASKIYDTKAEQEIRHFNFENLITKTEIYNKQIPNSIEAESETDNLNRTIQNERSETLYFQKSSASKSVSDDRQPKFLRPSTLPLKPGTFTPKRHHGITPNANTLPLVSPETPRPAKAYGQLYLNGNAYTYLGLKCSTKVFYCTINRPQPTYVPNQHFLSMYSNWQLLSELTPDPLGLSASSAMSLYDSRHRPQNVSVSVIKQDLILTHSSQWNKSIKENLQSVLIMDTKKMDDKAPTSDSSLTPKKELAGGFESNEEYTYVRGRGRGRYVCSECGIRCKKPSMLKKHIRTHTDVRPYTCKHCAFSFKTKGNLTKHMKSKAHYKKCCELGINPNEGNEGDVGEMSQCTGETDDESDSDGDEGNEGETESSDTEVGKSRLPEHEAAHCLLSLGGSRPATSATPGLITSARPTTYPYTPVDLESSTIETIPERLSNDRSLSVDSRDLDNEPMDLSKSEVKTFNLAEIPTAGESTVLASLASNTAKLPQHQSQWSNGEPMLHTYLTEIALLDTKIKQSQLANSTSKLKKIDSDHTMFFDIESKLNDNIKIASPDNRALNIVSQGISDHSVSLEIKNVSDTKAIIVTTNEAVKTGNDLPTSNQIHYEQKRIPTTSNSNAENAKFVVSEYIKHAQINQVKANEDLILNQFEGSNETFSNTNTEDKTKRDDLTHSDSELVKMPMEHEQVARKVVIRAGGVEFKVTKGKDFEGTSSYSPGRLMEDGRRVCDFCNKTFTKPSQLRLHLNIHYMERPFRCTACAVSFRTRGHLQKHERSGSHHNKVSMTSTFGTATSLNPRPFRCSDCNIAFRIHGHLAKHLRSKMHVMRLECLFKLPFGTFTEIERAGVSLTDIDTTDCASSLASLQSLARKLHEKDPSKLEYREPSSAQTTSLVCKESSEDDDGQTPTEKLYDSVIKTYECNEEDKDKKNV